MSRVARVALGSAVVFVAGLCATGCGSSSHPSAVSDGAAFSAGAATANAGTGADDGTGAGSNINVGGTSSSGGAAAFDSCVAHVSTAMPIPLDMYIMLDVSGSMLDVTASNVTKWDAVKSALETFLQDKASAGLGVGLQYFPLIKPDAPSSCATDADCSASNSGPCFTSWCYGAIAELQQLVSCSADSDCVASDKTNYGPCSTVAQCSKNTDYICPSPGSSCGSSSTGAALGTCTASPPDVCEATSVCDVAKYAAPATAIAVLPAAAAGLVASIDSKMPDGGTPTAPALSGAIEQAGTWAKAHPDHRVVAVLATDGLPTDCTPTDIAPVAALAAAGVAASPSISTFVIGVFGTEDVANGAPGNLDTIAKQGGTKQAFIVDTTKDVTTQFVAALDAIRGARLACEFQIPEPQPGESLNYSQVNMQFDSSGKTSTEYYVEDAAHCDASTGGWYYDVLPTAGTPTKMIACPTTCAAFQAATNASVGIALGCSTVVK
jgi:hypothetical protein